MSHTWFAASVTLAAGATCALVLPGSHASATGDASSPDLIVLIDQDRSVSAEAWVYTPWGDYVDTDSISADGFGPFSAEVLADIGGGPARARQDSGVSGHGFTASGFTSVAAQGGTDCTIRNEYHTWGQAISHYEVSFELTTPLEMTCRFHLEPAGRSEGWLDGPEGTINFAPGLRQTEMLVPGLYTLFVDIRAEASNRCPNGVREITDARDYAFRLEPCPDDLDRSGAVDFGDILAVIETWGDCPGCAEDLDMTGVVDVREILIVLGSWGACD